jgi:hypothetical protein
MKKQEIREKVVQTIALVTGVEPKRGFRFKDPIACRQTGEILQTIFGICPFISEGASVSAVVRQLKSKMR